jgi:hypothetical protein
MGRKLWSESIDALVELGLFWDYKRVRLVGSSLLKRRTFLNLRHCTHLKALQRKMLALSKGKAFFFSSFILYRFQMRALSGYAFCWRSLRARVGVVFRNVLWSSVHCRGFFFNFPALAVTSDPRRGRMKTWISVFGLEIDSIRHDPVWNVLIRCFSVEWPGPPRLPL